MTELASPAALAQECQVFSRYLATAEATPYVVEAYARGHRHLPAMRVQPDVLDQLLLRFARRSPWCARVADAYARRARPTGILRQKLVLQLAVLEASPPAHAWINGAEVGPAPVILAKVAWAVALSLATLGAATLIFGPLHLLAAIRTGRKVA